MLNFFNLQNSEKFIVVHPSEISLFELHEKDLVTDFIYDTPKLQNLSKNEKVLLSAQSLTHLLYLCIVADNLKFISQLDSSVSFLNSEKRYQYIKCASPSYHNDELLVACGEASGKVSIINFNPTSDNYLEFSEYQLDVVQQFV